MDDLPYKDGGGSPKAHEGWGLLLETGEQISKDKPKGYKSFPESGHTKSALDFMNESISEFHSTKGTGNKYNGFGLGTFPSFPC
jgi:hypothetical protein